MLVLSWFTWLASQSSVVARWKVSTKPLDTLKGIVHPRNENSVIHFSPSCSSKPERSSLIFGTQIALWYSRECALKTDTEEKKLLNKVIIFVFFAHKKYSHSFIKLQLNHWCHIDYFNDVLTTLLDLECGSCVAVYGGSESSWISSKIS